MKLLMKILPHFNVGRPNWKCVKLLHVPVNSVYFVSHQSNIIVKSKILGQDYHYVYSLMSHRYLSLGLTLPYSQTLEPVSENPLTPSTLPSPSTSPVQGSPDSCSGYIDKVQAALKKTIEKKSSKASSTSIDIDVRDFCHYYSLLHFNEKQEIILFIAHNLSTNHERVTEIINSIPTSEVKDGENVPVDKEAFIKWEDKLRQTLQPPYHWLVTQISRLSSGVKFIVDLRADLLKVLSNQSLLREDQAVIKTFDLTLKELLGLWFTVGLLNLQRITWDSPCDILQKVSEYEAVHPMRNWIDLKRRVGNYRRCFMFTHSCMPNEPLVVLHTFLTNGISNNMSKIVQCPRYMSVDESSMKPGEDYSSITTAIFYSITSTQKGLQGIELGNYLIKRVVRELQGDLPHLSQFSSLSPIPGFNKWLDTYFIKAQKGEIGLFAASEMASLREELQVCNDSDVYCELRRMFKTNAWTTEDSLKSLLESPIIRLCAYYLYLEKRRGFALDPVANFHLKNGAMMWRINWNADKSPRGLDTSGGIMVNYRYFLEDCEKNSQNYLETSKILASDAIIHFSKMAEELIMKREESGRYRH